MRGLGALLLLPAVALAATPLAEIPAGRYQPLYGERGGSIAVAPFALEVRPVTNAQFLDFVRAQPRWQRDAIPPLFADADYLRHWAGPLEPGELAPAEAPVTNVSWFAAKAYCEAQGRRLPSLDEWEYAAGADENRADAAQDPAFQRRILSWYGAPTKLPLPAVGDGLRNLWGVYDLHGLVWEWVLDFNAVMLTGESRKDAGGTDPQLFCAGGSVGSADPGDYASFMRYALRSSVKARHAVQNLGFRCATDIEPTP